VPADRQVDPAAAYWKTTTNRPDKAQDGDRLRAKVQAALAERRKLDAANKPPEVSLVPERQRPATVGSGPEDTGTPAPLLPAWRDRTGQGRDRLGRGTSPEDLARVADKDPMVMGEAAARTRTLQVIYRDPEAAADALNALIRRSGNDLRAAARTLRQDGPESLGELRGRERWLAREAAKTERI
jgi:BID domain of Bartonella effector protein (Bep)